MDVDSIALAGIWLRHIPAGGDPLFQPADPADYRWQRGAVVDALYFADSEATAWAEWYRALAEAALPPRHSLPRALWRWQVGLPRVADLSAEAQRKRVGLPPIRPMRSQWPAFQAVGEGLHRDGWAALVSASAARPDGRTLCVFRTAREVNGATPIPPPRVVDEPPVVPTGLRT